MQQNIRAIQISTYMNELLLITDLADFLACALTFNNLLEESDFLTFLLIYSKETFLVCS